MLDLLFLTPIVGRRDATMLACKTSASCISSLLAFPSLALCWLAGTVEFLRKLELDKDSLTKSIIGTIGDVDSYQLPDSKGSTAFMRHILQISDEERQERREQILGTTLKDFRYVGTCIRLIMPFDSISIVVKESSSTQCHICT